MYTRVIRPVLEYAAAVRNHLLTKTQIDQLETIQRRALRIIYSYTNDMPYINALYCAAIPSLADRREQLSRKFFKSVQLPSSCLSSLLPNPRDPSITTRIRFANKFPRQPYEKNIRYLFPTLCLTIRLHSHIQPSILVFCSFFFKFPPLLFDCSCIYHFIYCCLFVCLPCVVLFGLMATRVNKH